MADLILALIFVLFTYSGYRSGLVKSLLGMLSLFVCGFVTMHLYSRLSVTGITEKITALVSERLPELSVGLEYFSGGIMIVVLFIAVKLVYSIVVKVIDFGAPSFLNKPLGAVFCFAKCFGLVLVMLGIITFIAKSGNGKAVLEFIEASKYTKELYANNILLNLMGL